MPGRTACVVAVLAPGIAAAIGGGDLFSEHGRIIDLPWERDLLLDVCAGIALLSAWVAWREGRGNGRGFRHGRRRTLAKRPDRE